MNLQVKVLISIIYYQFKILNKIFEFFFSLSFWSWHFFKNFNIKLIRDYWYILSNKPTKLNKIIFTSNWLDKAVNLHNEITILSNTSLIM